MSIRSQCSELIPQLAIHETRRHAFGCIKQGAL